MKTFDPNPVLDARVSPWRPRRRRRTRQRVRQGGHDIPEEAIRRRFAAGLRNFERVYKGAVNDWAKYDNVGEKPILLEWGIGV